MKNLFLSLALFLTLATATSAHADSIVIGEGCSVLGTSLMTSDQQNIATCLNNTDNKPVWKGMTAEAASGLLCGASIVYLAKSSPSGRTVYSTTNISQCKKNDVISAAGQNTLTTNCPSGYTVNNVFLNSSTSISGIPTHEGYPSTTTNSYFYFCAAN